jgi:hypothetical protein
MNGIYLIYSKIKTKLRVGMCSLFELVHHSCSSVPPYCQMLENSLSLISRAFISVRKSTRLKEQKLAEFINEMSSVVILCRNCIEEF